MKLEIGKTYDINTQRKGKFRFRPLAESSEWVDGIVVSGRTKAMLPENSRESGEEITLRKEFIISAQEV